ncbi:MAG: DUF1367 family protein [Pseudomonadota bacterium]
MDLALVRTANGLVGATEADRELIGKIKHGATIHGDFKKMRNAKLHGKFFAMLDLAWSYWEPSGGLVPRQELRGIEGLAKYFEELNDRPGQLTDAVLAYVNKLTAERAERFPAVDKSREAFREFITIDAGHFDLVMTPEGVKKTAKSISWGKMDDLQFAALYKDVFNACWRLVLSSHFASEAEAMGAADNMNTFA